MTLQLSLSAELEKRLRLEAERAGISSDAVALRLLDEHLPPPMDDRRARAIALLGEWIIEDAKLSDEELESNAEVLRRLLKGDLHYVIAAK